MTNEHAKLEARLRSGAESVRRRTPAGLQGRILAELREHALDPAPRPLLGRLRPRPVVLALVASAAAVLVAFLAWPRGEEAASTERSPTAASLQALVQFDPGPLIASSAPLRGAGTRETRDPLTAERDRLLADTERAVDSYLRRLPAPLRRSLAR